MGKSIYLPPAEDTTVNIHIGKDTVTIDLFDLEEYFAEAQTKAEEMGTEWQHEFPSIFKNHTKSVINPGQAILLWTAHRTKLEELKKSLFLASESYAKQDTSKQRRTKKKE